MISKEKKEWGVRLTLFPLGEEQSFKIVGEIQKREGKPPETRFWIDATPSQKPLRMTDMTVLQQGLHQFVEAVKDEVAQAKRKKK